MAITIEHYTHNTNSSVQKRAAIYARVSTDLQEQEGTSLISQVELCREFCHQRGYVLDEEHIYRDIYTGTEYRSRPELSRMREAMRRAEFDIVVVLNVDRLSRVQIHLAVLIDEAKHIGIQIEFVQQQFDDSPVGQFLRNTLGFVAELEREKILERTERGRLTKMQQGKLLGGGRPKYGYDWNDDRTAYIINPDEAKIVRRIFALAANGYSHRSIAFALMEDHVPTRMGNSTWRDSSIHNILSNSCYVGKAKWYKRHYEKKGSSRHTVFRPESELFEMPENTVPAIVSQEEFDIVQRQLQVNKQEASRNNVNPQDTLLRCGFIFCGYCEGRMGVHRNKRRGKINYHCKKGQEGLGKCKIVAISAKILDEAVWKRVTEVISNPQLVIEKLGKSKNQNLTHEELKPIDRRIQETTRKQANYERMMNRDLDDDVMDDIARKLNELAKEKRSLEKEREAVLKEQAQQKDEQEKIDEFIQWCHKMSNRLEEATYDERRRACEILGVRVLVWRTEHHKRFEIQMFPTHIVSTSLYAHEGL